MRNELNILVLVASICDSAALNVPSPPPRPLSAAQLQALPGDPSLILHTTVSLGDEKKAFMKAASAAIAATLSKPESYVAVCVHDDADIIWAGDETPCALGSVCSIGAINQANNAALSAAVSELLAPFGVPSDKICALAPGSWPAPVPFLSHACRSMSAIACEIPRYVHTRCCESTRWLARNPLADINFFDVPRENCG